MNGAQLILWDMDGVLYPYTKESKAAAQMSALGVLAKNIPDQDPDTLLQLSKKSYEEYGDSFTLAAGIYGFDTKQALKDFHANLSSDFIQPVGTDFTNAMRQTKADHAILTMGNRPWATDVLARCVLFEFFRTHNTITCEDYEPHTKRLHCEPFIYALDRMGYKAEDVIMVEDSQKNLKHAKEIGMTTVLVHPKADLIQKNYTDFVFETPRHFLKAFNGVRI